MKKDILLFLVFAIGLATAPNSSIAQPQVFKDPNIILHIAPEDSNDGFGSGKATGFFDNNNYKDLVVMAPHFCNGNGEKVGKAYLYYGTPNGIDTSSYFEIEGIHPIDEHPELDYYRGLYSVKTGDFNNDRFDDFAVGTSCYQRYSVGSNKARGYAMVFLSNLDGSGLDLYNYIEIIGNTPYGNFTYPGMRTGDVNGDHVDDLIISSINDGGEHEGRIYIYYGGDTFDNQFDKVLYASIRGRDKLRCKGIGDINGDGFDDIIGWDFYNGDRSYAQIHIWLGDSVDISQTPSYSKSIPHQKFSCVGDLNNDSFDDIVIRDWWKTHPKCSPNLFILPGAANIAINSYIEIPLDGHHSNCSSIRDVNGDGVNDTFVDIRDENDHAITYVFSGDETDYIDVTDTLLQFIDSDSSYGLHVSGVIPGDMNGDGEFEYYAYSQMKPYKGVIFIYNSKSSRIVRVVDANAPTGSTVSVLIELIGQGDENALGFSLTFDPSVLSNPQATLGSDATSAMILTNSNQVTSGKYGIALALPAGNTFIADTNEVVIVSFSVDLNTIVDSTIISFGDQPITREVVNANADTLPADWISGSIKISRGFEADVAPRFFGNDTISITDCVQVGLFAAKLDTPRTDVNEFQRADCAPRPCGDGRVGISDWVQACLYAARLDSPVLACGPLSPTPSLNNPICGYNIFKLTDTRKIFAVNTNFQIGITDSLFIELNAYGDENAMGFSLYFDPNSLIFENVHKGKSAASAMLIQNISHVTDGHVGIALALPAGETFPAGTHEIVIATFTAGPSFTSDSILIEFGDQPITREVVDLDANGLNADWVPAKITITTSVEEISEDVPLTFNLLQNYPNPFNPETSISYQVPKTAHVTIDIFNLLGQRIRTLVDEHKNPGSYQINWDGLNYEGKHVVSGIYLYRMQAGKFTAMKKMVLVR